MGRREEALKCPQPAPGLRSFGRRPAAGPSRRPRRPRPAPRPPPPLPDHGRPAAAAAAAVVRAGAHPRPGYSPHFPTHRTPLPRPAEVSPIPAPSDPHPGGTGQGPGARAPARRMEFSGGDVANKVKQAPNAGGGRKNTAPRPLTEPRRDPDSRRSALPVVGPPSAHPGAAPSSPERARTWSDAAHQLGDPPSCSGLRERPRPRHNLAETCATVTAGVCAATLLRPARRLSTPSPPARPRRPPARPPARRPPGREPLRRLSAPGRRRRRRVTGARGGRDAAARARAGEGDPRSRGGRSPGKGRAGAEGGERSRPPAAAPLAFIYFSDTVRGGAAGPGPPGSGGSREARAAAVCVREPQRPPPLPGCGRTGLFLAAPPRTEVTRRSARRGRAEGGRKRERLSQRRHRIPQRVPGREAEPEKPVWSRRAGSAVRRAGRPGREGRAGSSAAAPGGRLRPSSRWRAAGNSLESWTSDPLPLPRPRLYSQFWYPSRKIRPACSSQVHFWSSAECFTSTFRAPADAPTFLARALRPRGCFPGVASRDASGAPRDHSPPPPGFPNGFGQRQSQAAAGFPVGRAGTSGRATTSTRALASSRKGPGVGAHPALGGRARESQASGGRGSLGFLPGPATPGLPRAVTRRVWTRVHSPARFPGGQRPERLLRVGSPPGADRAPPRLGFRAAAPGRTQPSARGASPLASSPPPPAAPPPCLGRSKQETRKI
ncbi:basic proline-rich protein-like [Lepus europaeus]|uniref:basic proline-rich protein-like n=1 Tax=Lepus europaeus TaxID=9983 RepID=UPI002B482E1D|nr:basic proline-rich protein-like [Lepus europaeus]